MRNDVFLRKETKYIISLSQYHCLKALMSRYMKIDKYGKQTINNVYLDNDNFEIISRSVEKPIYKEKVRMRVYGCPQENSVAYLELKKKYKGVVFKRRIQGELADMENYFYNGVPPLDSQIFREIDYVVQRKDLRPMVRLLYEREAYYGIDDPDFRITFDTGVRFCRHDCSLTQDLPMTKIIGDDVVLMETKCHLVYPRWLINFLDENGIRKTSFSKYGKAYTDFILANGTLCKKESNYV